MKRPARDPAAVAAADGAIRLLRDALSEHGSIVIVLPPSNVPGLPILATTMVEAHVSRILRQLADVIDEGQFTKPLERGQS